MNLVTDGIVMGGRIYITDLILRPNLGDGIMELIRFLAEGYVCVYLYTNFGSGSGSSCSDEGSGAGDYSDGFQVPFMAAGLAAITIKISDEILRIDYFESVGGEMMKFFIQGITVSFILGSAMTRQCNRAMSAI